MSRKWELVYLSMAVLIVLVGVGHFILLILKVERELNIPFSVVVLPALVAYGLGGILFLQVSGYWRLIHQNPRLSVGFGALFILVIGSFITQSMLSLKFDLTKAYTLGQTLIPVLVALGVASVIFIVNVYVATKKPPRAFDLFYLVVTFVILAAGVSHFLLVILKSERDLEISFLLVASPALIAYGLGVVLFSQISLYQWIVERNLKVGLAFAVLALMSTGSLISQLSLALRFDLIRSTSYTRALLPVVVAFAVASGLFIFNLYVGARLRFPFFSK